MAEFSHETTIIVAHDDIAKILTEEACKGYGILRDLQVTIIKENGEGDFVLTLTPKPPESE